MLYFKKPGSTGPLDLFESGLQFLIIPALLGFAYHRALGRPWMWQLATLCLAVISTVQLFSKKHREIIAKMGPVRGGLVIFASLALGFPAFYALIRYAFFSASLW